MIHFNEKLTQEQAQWLLNTVFPVFDHRIAHPTLSKIMEMHNLAFKEQVSIPGCSCEHRATHAVWCSRLSQYRPNIEAIANPPVVEEPKTRKKRDANSQNDLI
jgi:hypothetical protein